MDPGAQLHASKSLRPSSSELALEGIRAAQLSGFLICVHARVQAETKMGKVAELIRHARSIDVDGMLVTATDSGSNCTASDAAALQRKSAEARKLIGSKWWESFSRLVEPVLTGKRHATQSPGETVLHLEQKEQSNAEGVKVA